MNAVDVGARIFALRKEKGWTQKQLAENIHVTDKAVSKWERGMNFPDLTTVERLAKVLDISPAALLGLEQDTADEALAASVTIHKQSRKNWLMELKSRAWQTIIHAVLLCAGSIWLSKYLSDREIYGLPQGVLGCMIGLFGLFIGNGIYTLRLTQKRLRE